MEFRQVYISKSVNYKKEITYVSNGKIFVSGLGEVEIKECLSHVTINNIEKEVIFALRHKLGLLNISDLNKDKIVPKESVETELEEASNDCDN